MATDSSSDRDPVERLAEEYLELRRRGQGSSIDDYADRYPQWADRIREVFPALEMMERLKPGSGDRTGSFDGRAGTGEVPERLGEYRILREVGHGGMGVVYEALQESLGRHVALKVLPFHGRVDPVQMERFRLEARSAARLHHTHIVPVHGVGQHEGVHFYAMQFIQGCGLDAVIDDLRRLRSGEAPRPVGSETSRADAQSRAVAESLLGRGSTVVEGSSRPGSSSASSDGSNLSGQGELGYHRSVARIGVQVAEALAHAHGQGVQHRDIKPSNLLLDADGEAWVTDFGLAKVEGSDGPTRTGDVVGTLRYMAPERFEGWSDPRSDVYGLGMTLYEMLTLHPAYEAATRARLIERVLHATPPQPRKIDPKIPRDLETIVMKAIAKEPAERYMTAQLLADDLTNFLVGKPIRARRVGMPERVWRWCRRNPSAAGLIGVSGIAALALVGLIVGLVFYSALTRSHREAVTARTTLASVNVELEGALKGEKAARNDQATIRYFNDMLLAEREWTDSNVGRAEQLLDDHPKSHGWEWNYLKRQCHTDLKTIKVPETQGMGLALSPDDRYMATTSDDMIVRVWNLQTGVLEQPLDGLTGDMCDGLAYSPDGLLLAASSGGGAKPGNLIVWETATWRQPLNIPDMCGESSSDLPHESWALGWSQDAKRTSNCAGLR